MLKCNFKKHIGPIRLNIDFELTNEKLGIRGHSGGGKSTLLNCISGIETVTSGEIRFENKIWNSLSIQERKTGYVLQQPTLFPNMTVRKNLEYAGLRNPEIEETLKIDSFITLYPNELSGGQKQRVSLAQNIIRKPQLLLLDEVTSAQDERMKDTIITLLKSIKLPMLVVSHDNNVLQKLCSRTLELYSHNETDFTFKTVKW